MPRRTNKATAVPDGLREDNLPAFPSTPKETTTPGIPLQKRHRAEDTWKPSRSFDRAVRKETRKSRPSFGPVFSAIDTDFWRPPGLMFSAVLLELEVAIDNAAERPSARWAQRYVGPSRSPPRFFGCRSDPIRSPVQSAAAAAARTSGRWSRLAKKSSYRLSTRAFSKLRTA